MPISTEITLAISIDKETEEQNVIITDNLTNQDSDTQDFVSTWVGHAIDASRQVIRSAVENSGGKTAAKILTSGQVYIASIEYEYLQNLKAEEAREGGTPSRDKFVALGQTVGGLAVDYGTSLTVDIFTKNLAAGISFGIFMKENYESKFLASSTKSPKDLLGDFIRNIYPGSSSNPIIAIESEISGTPSQTKTTKYNLSPELSDGMLIASLGDNILQGAAGSDNTYYIPTLNGQNIVNDPDGNGIIKIGNPPVILQGNALPKKDSFGNIIGGQWTLNGYDLIRSKNNMIIVFAGCDPSSLETPRITINNFPFSNPNAFGLLLGKKINGLDDINKLHFDHSLFNTIVFNSITDKRGRFFAPALVARQRSRSEKDYAIKIYNSEGLAIKTQKLTNLPISSDTTTANVATIGQSYRLKNGNVGFIYTVSKVETNPTTGAFVAGNSKAYLAVTDANGNVISNSEVKEYRESVEPDYQYNILQPSHITSKGICFTAGGNKFFCQKFSADGSLSGSMNLVPFEQIAQFEALAQETTSVNLASGHKITAINQGFNIRDPLYIDMTATEIPERKSIIAGNIANAAEILQGIVTFQDAVDTATAAGLKITPIPNQKLIINGLDIGYLDISAFHPALTLEQIVAQISEVDASEFSEIDLLSGRYNPSSDLGKRNVDPERKDYFPSEKEFEIDGGDLKERSGRDATEEALNESPEIFTVLDLGQGQLLIFPRINEKEFLNRIPEFFIGYVANELPTIQKFNTSFPTTPFINNFTSNATEISGYVPPQINNETQNSNPLAQGSLGFGFLVGGAILFTAGVMAPQLTN